MTDDRPVSLQAVLEVVERLSRKYADLAREAHLEGFPTAVPQNMAASYALDAVAKDIAALPTTHKAGEVEGALNRVDLTIKSSTTLTQFPPLARPTTKD